MALSEADHEVYAVGRSVSALEGLRAARPGMRHLQVEQMERDRSIGFDDAATMRRAALHGIGVGLISVIDAEEDLRSSALVAPLGHDALVGMKSEEIPGFYLVVPRGHLRVKAVAALHRWLSQEDWRSDLEISPVPRPALLSG